MVDAVATRSATYPLCFARELKDQCWRRSVSSRGSTAGEWNDSF
jgi:hypothetical protein